MRRTLLVAARPATSYLHRLCRNPDRAVFWLSTTLCALFYLYVPGSPV